MYGLHQSTAGCRNGDSAEETANDSDELNDEVGILDAYTQLWGVVKLPAVRRLAFVLVTSRLAMMPAESAAPLKLLEKGVSKVRAIMTVYHMRFANGPM